jgi:hypothetical protein
VARPRKTVGNASESPQVEPELPSDDQELINKLEELQEEIRLFKKDLDRYSSRVLRTLVEGGGGSEAH